MNYLMDSISDKVCICGAAVTKNTAGFVCPRCFRSYSVKGKLINNFYNSFIEFEERFTSSDDKTMYYEDWDD